MRKVLLRVEAVRLVGFENLVNACAVSEDVVPDFVRARESLAARRAERVENDDRLRAGFVHALQAWRRGEPNCEAHPLRQIVDGDRSRKAHSVLLPYLKGMTGSLLSERFEVHLFRPLRSRREASR